MAENLRNAGGNIPLALRYYNGGYDKRRWGGECSLSSAVLGHYQKIINGDAGGTSSGSIIQSAQNTGPVSVNDITKSFKSAMEDNKLKLEITMVSEKGIGRF